MKNKRLELLVIGILAGFTSLIAWKGRDIVNFLETQYNKRAPIEWVYKSSSSEKTVLKSSFEKKVLPSGHTLYVVYGQHFSQDGAEHIYKNTVPDIEKNPRGWLFLVEGGLKDGRTVGPENRFAEALSERYNIPVDDVIVCDYEVVDIVKEQGFGEDEIYQRILFSRYAVASAILGYSESRSRDCAAKEVARLSGKDEEYLGRLIGDYLSQKPDEEREKQLDCAILNARNQISRQNLEEILGSPNTPKNILLIIGGKHYEITRFQEPTSK
jgi:hypothetical protein